MKKESLAGRFLECAGRFPERTAIVHQSHAITYAELKRNAQRLAHYLVNQYHIEPEQLVGIHGLRSIDSITAMLAAMLAGGAYVPIPADWPALRKREIITDAHMDFLLNADLSAAGDWCDAALVPVAEICRQERDEHISLPELKTEQLAYVIYTSGSTGKPKGAMLEHRNTLNMLDAFEQLAPHAPAPVGAGLVSIGFDVSVWEIFSVLCFGGTLHLIDHPEMVPDLVRYFGDHQIDSAYLPPMILDDFIQSAGDQGVGLALQRMLVGVEPIAQQTLQRFMDVLPGLKIINGYGPTETAICATFYPFQKALKPERRTPIGKALAGNRVYLVDEHDEQVAAGEEGEILICGAGVGRGYYADAELTAAKFISDPFSRGDERCFRSGDFARRLPDGNIEFIGRKDQQFKLSGYRVEAGEIEAALMKCRDVQHAVVLVRQAAGETKYISAYYTTTNGQPLQVGEMRKVLAEHLPVYMQPHTLQHLDEFPRTINGKIDRSRLPASQENVDGQPNRSETAMESALLDIYRQVFESAIQSVNADFFALGGNSLQAARIILRIKEQLQYDLIFKEFYEHPVLTDLAAWLDEREPDARIDEGDSIPACPQGGKVPLSNSQERLWFMAQSEPDNPSLHSSFVLRLTGELDVACLLDSLAGLLDRHAILRTIFKSEAGVPYQKVLSHLDLPIYQVDLSENPNPQEDLAARITDLNLETFDISAAPPFRMGLFKISEQDHALVVIIHHIIVDGWSAEVFRQDLAQVYQANLAGKAVPPLSNTVRYVDYACWQHSQAFEKRIQPQLAYWKEYLTADQNATYLPKDKPRPPSKTSNAATLWLELTGENLQELNRYCRQKNCTQFSVLFAAFCMMLHNQLHQDTIQLGSFYANRPLKELENIMGPFVNGVVLKLDLRGNPSFDELVDRAAEIVMQAQQNQEVPIEKVIGAINARRDRSQRTLFGIVFNYVNVPRVPIAPAGLKMDYMEFEAGTVIYDLNVEFSDNDKGIVFDFEYNTDIYDQETIERLVQHYQMTLNQVLDDPARHIADYEPLTADEAAQIEAWSAPTASFPLDKPIHRLFEEQVVKSPQKIALVFGDEEITYADLNHRANQLAGILCKEGLDDEDLVGICLPRSVDMLAAVLAVLKAGGAYLPLDPAYPRAHLHKILEDANPVFVLTNKDNRELLPVEKNKIICLEDWQAEIQTETGENLNVPVSANQLAYCIYTSGSTGRPKGVLVEHRSLVNYTCAAVQDFEITDDDYVLQFASLNFDTSAEEIFPALCSGAALVLRTQEMLDNLARFLDCCRDWRLTVLDLPTAFWHELVIYLQDSGSKLPETVRMIIIGGERVSPVHLDAWHRLGFNDVRLENTYGLTEGTCVITHCELTADDRRRYPYREAPIGRAVSNTVLYVLDESLRRVPPGVTGELYAGGACLAREYLNLPAMTADRFITNPFSPAEQDRLFKTGDLVQWRLDGTLEYLGRSDEQIKIRGFRIEPGEIESVLVSYAAISDAVVIKRQDPAGTDQLLAYLLLEKEAHLDEKELRNFIKGKLPKYMLPAFYKVLDAFPYSANLKIDKRALPDPDWHQIPAGHELKKPETPTEEKMLVIWERALGRNGIGVEDNFFDIGGHSLLAARMMTEVEAQFGIPVPLVELLEKPTIRQLSSAITDADWKPSWKSVVMMKASGSLSPLFLVHAIGGDILSYRRLVKRLQGLDRPIYGIRSQGLGGVVEPFDTVPDMAAYYLKEIREVQTSGPYLIGGYSFGGTVAYEMAQQLHAAGEEPAFLGMFDTVVLDTLPDELRPGKLAMAYDQLCRFWFVIKKWLGLSLPKKLAYIGKINNIIAGFFKAFFDKKKYVNPKEQKDHERWLRKPPAFQKVEKINKKALASYIAAPYAGKITLFKARQREWSEMVNPEPLWRSLTGGKLDVYVCEGNHDTILVNPYVESLAAELLAALEEIKIGEGNE